MGAVDCKTCSSSDLQMGIFNSRTKQAVDNEDFNSKDFSSFPQIQQLPRQDTSTEDISSPSFLVAVGTAFIVANVLLATALAPKRYKLEDDNMCGITTGGKAECYFDCISTSSLKEPSVRLIKNLTCLEDCFDDPLGKKCLRGLVQDVKDKGVCNLGSETGINPGAGVYESNKTDCGQYSPDPLEPNISKGTCSNKTEEVLQESKCRDYILQQPPIITNTATELISSACSKNVSKQYVEVKVKYDNTTCGCTPLQFEDVTANLKVPTIPTKVDLPPFPWYGKKE